MEIYNDATYEEIKCDINELLNNEQGYVYYGTIQVGTTDEKWEVMDGTDGLKKRVPPMPIIKKCQYYHEYTSVEKIELLKNKLLASDYVVIKIAEGVATKEEYADIIAKRSEWREEINNLTK